MTYLSWSLEITYRNGSGSPVDCNPVLGALTVRMLLTYARSPALSSLGRLRLASTDATQSRPIFRFVKPRRKSLKTKGFGVGGMIHAGARVHESFARACVRGHASRAGVPF